MDLWVKDERMMRILRYQETINMPDTKVNIRIEGKIFKHLKK